MVHRRRAAIGGTKPKHKVSRACSRNEESLRSLTALEMTSF